MSSREEPPTTMLILSRAIYAKKSNNNFCPGTVETKLPDGSYLIRFTDGASERVEEHEITWLGFWGLPPWLWPQNPIVQPVDSADAGLLNGQLRNNSTKDDISSYVSFRTLFHESSGKIKRVNGSRRPEMDLGISNGCDDSASLRRQSRQEAKFEQNPAHVSPSHISENQMRTSVLRMCCNESGLKPENGRTEAEVISMENQAKIPDFMPSPHSISSSNEDRNNFNFDEDETQNIGNDLSKRKRKLSSPEYEEYSVRNKCNRTEDIENKLQSSPSLQKHYPISPTLPPLLSHHFQNYGHPFGISIHNSTSPPRPASFRLQTRTRRRSESKKCRKVYGIENRDIWCTQCKWKKACTRFAAAEKNDLREFMYISDYEGRHYPV